MEQIKLDVQLRDRIGTRKIRSVYREGFLPAIVYGEGQQATPVNVNRKAYEGIMRQQHGQNVIFHLNVLQGEKKLSDDTAIIREEYHHPVSDRLLHLDFQRISLKKEIEVKVAIHTTGDPIGVKKDGGSLDHTLWELDIICLPTNIPDKIEIEVGHLLIGDAIHLKDIKLPEGVRTKHDPEAILVSVVPPMKEEVEIQPQAEPEVLKEKPKEEAAAGAEGKPAKAEEKKPEEKTK